MDHGRGHGINRRFLRSRHRDQRCWDRVGFSADEKISNGIDMQHLQVGGICQYLQIYAGKSMGLPRLCSNRVWVALGQTQCVAPSCLIFRNLWNCGLDLSSKTPFRLSREVDWRIDERCKLCRDGDYIDIRIQSNKAITPKGRWLWSWIGSLMYLMNVVTEKESMVPGESLGLEWLRLLQLAGNSVMVKREEMFVAHFACLIRFPAFSGRNAEAKIRPLSFLWCSLFGLNLFICPLLILLLPWLAYDFMPIILNCKVVYFGVRDPELSLEPLQNFLVVSSAGLKCVITFPPLLRVNLPRHRFQPLRVIPNSLTTVKRCIIFCTFLNVIAWTSQNELCITFQFQAPPLVRVLILSSQT